MESRETNVQDLNAGRPRFQFSLRLVLGVITAFAIVLAGLTTGPERRAVLTAISLSLCYPAALTIMVIRGRGYIRAFCVGALVPAAGMLPVALFFGAGALEMSSTSGPSDTMRFYAVMFLACSFGPTVLFGLLAIGVRYLVEGRRRK